MPWKKHPRAILSHKQGFLKSLFTSSQFMPLVMVSSGKKYIRLVSVAFKLLLHGSFRTLLNDSVHCLSVQCLWINMYPTPPYKHHPHILWRNYCGIKRSLVKNPWKGLCYGWHHHLITVSFTEGWFFLVATMVGYTAWDPDDACY